MTGTAFVISCGIYLLGADLDLDLITSLVGVEPTRTSRRGDLLLAGGSVIARRSKWAYVAHGDGADFEQPIQEVLAAFDGVQIDLRSLPGVVDAYLDVYGTADRAGGYDSAHFTLTGDQIQRLAALGLFMGVSISAFDRSDDHAVSSALPNLDSDT